ncbi:hypothetical protein BPOR_0382g00010 [Botrytis porri]|uniref:Uncharacterized protein n=2 Tax=Botrytis porri TaxID=87229 RepID=A0A4Z1KSD6_9HELO|nr:hypothetical protein BPOR_0382g00010 [Botrytis porri]
MDTHLMRHLSPLSSLLALLNPLPDFGLLTHNLPAFRAHVESHFSTVRTKEEQYFHTLLAVAPEPELKMVLRIFDDWYIYKFPRRAGCLIFPDDFEDQPAQPAGEMDSEDSEESESACHFPDRDEGAVDVDVDVGADTEVPALVYRQGWGWKPKYVVTASFAGDVGVQYPLYHF